MSATPQPYGAATFTVRKADWLNAKQAIPYGHRVIADIPSLDGTLRYLTVEGPDLPPGDWQAAPDFTYQRSGQRTWRWNYLYPSSSLTPEQIRRLRPTRWQKFKNELRWRLWR